MREEFTQGRSSKTPGRPEHEANKGTSDRNQVRAGLVQFAMMLDLAAVWALFGPGEVMKSGSSEWTVPIRTDWRAIGRVCRLLRDDAANGVCPSGL